MIVVVFILRLITKKYCKETFLLKRLYFNKLGHVLIYYFIYNNCDCPGFVSEVKQYMMFNILQAKIWKYFGVMEYRKNETYRIFTIEAYILSVNKMWCWRNNSSMYFCLEFRCTRKFKDLEA